eukprot:37759-Eustigmatos_ZCMA.PRE.1
MTDSSIIISMSQATAAAAAQRVKTDFRPSSASYPKLVNGSLSTGSSSTMCIVITTRHHHPDSDHQLIKSSIIIVMTTTADGNCSA